MFFCFRDKKIILIIGLLLFLFLPFFSGATEEKPSSIIYLIKIEEEIKAGTLQYFKRVLLKAEKEKADFLLIKLDTTGGLLNPTKDIIDLILKSKTKTIVFVHKEGGWAYSAGTFILLAADFAVSHPEASIGAAQPRLMIGEEITKEVDTKIVEGMSSWIKSLAEKNQRNSEIAEKFVRENLTLIGKEAKELKVINETARNLEELFSKLKIEKPKIEEVHQNFTEEIFDFLSHPYLVSLFLALGSLGLLFALKAGEFEFSGILGLLFLLIGLWGIGVIEFSILGIILILLGVILLIIEISQPGFEIFGVLGVLSLVLGIFTLEAEPFYGLKFFEPIVMIVLGASLMISILFIIIGKWTIKTLKSKPKTGPEALVGEVGVVKEKLVPFGKVEVKNEIWTAKSIDGENIPQNLKVEIIKIEGNTLIVKLKQYE